MSSVGGRIRAARTALDLTQHALAEAVGVRSLTVSRWERDVTVPYGENLGKLAEQLGVSSDWILNEIGRGPAKAKAHAP